MLLKIKRRNLRVFFGLVGLDAALADDIYAFAKNLKIKGGVLLQFFDKDLSNINNAAFVCSNNMAVGKK